MRPRRVFCRLPNCTEAPFMAQPAKSSMSGALLEASSIDEQRGHWLSAYRRVRAETEQRASFLSPEDQIVQSMADAAPTKWHRAHVTWFFETFLVREFDASY